MDDFRTNHKKPYINTFVNCGGKSGKCHGKFIRNVCNFGVEDLPALRERFELFLNKFLLDLEPLAVDCLEEYLANRTLREFEHGVDINTTFYENLLITKYHI